MKIGSVKEIKNNEFRVGLTPDNVKAYVSAGHQVYIEKGAGLGSGYADEEYAEAGAAMVDSAADVWHEVDMSRSRFRLNTNCSMKGRLYIHICTWQPIKSRWMPFWQEK